MIKKLLNTSKIKKLEKEITQITNQMILSNSSQAKNLELTLRLKIDQLNNLQN